MGRKRHIVVDTQGILMKVRVHPADVQERAGARLVLRKLGHIYRRLRQMWADGAYAGHWSDGWPEVERGQGSPFRSPGEATSRKGLEYCPGAGWWNARWHG